MELVRAIRQQSANNDSTMNSRRQILEGTTVTSQELPKVNTFLLRLLVAVLLLAGYATLVFSQKEKNQKMADTIVTEIEKDYDVISSVQAFSGKFLSEINIDKAEE